MNERIKSDDLQKTIINMLDKFGDSATVLLRDTCLEVGNETANVVQNHIDFGTGSYKENIKCEELSTGYKKRKKVVAVHADNGYYRIAHLLENGHQVISHGKPAGTAKAHPHFAYGEEYADKTLEKRYIEKVNALL